MTSDHTSENEKTTKAEDPSRRDFIYIATGAFAAAGVTAASWPMIAHLKPAPDAKYIAGIEIDLAQIPEGSQVKLLWNGKPVFIRHRTTTEIEAAQNVSLDDLHHKETDEQRLRPHKDGSYDPRFLIIIGVCTHFGCVPVGESGDFDGWFCPCHASHFDTSGRIRKGPAPLNLHVVPHHYISDTVVRIGYDRLDITDPNIYSRYEFEG
ncbi:MAG: ubiquinol-cytochrome c reductase iron-sulfur subunit [Maricaulaceae bacterium]